MLNSIAAGRRAALRAVGWQALATVLVALAYLAAGWSQALAAGLGGGALALGNALAALLALGRVVRAPAALARLLLGTLVKWGVVIAALVVALERLRLPAFPMMVGLVAATLAYLWALNGRADPAGPTSQCKG